MVWRFIKVTRKWLLNSLFPGNCFREYVQGPVKWWKIELSVKWCPVGLELQPSFDSSSPRGRCLQSHDTLWNQGMKYWDSGLNARGTITFIATVHKAAAVIGWMHSGKERTRQTQFTTKFAAKVSFMPRWSLVYSFFPVFWNLIPYVTKQGVPVLSFPEFTGNLYILKILSLRRDSWVDWWSICNPAVP